MIVMSQCFEVNRFMRKLKCSIVSSNWSLELGIYGWETWIKYYMRNIEQNMSQNSSMERVRYIPLVSVLIEV